MYSGKTVLIVDDDDIIRSTLHNILQRSMGVTVVEAPTPKEAFEFLRTATPDAIILDMQMPYMDGLTVVEHLRRIPKTRNIPILACTGLTHKDVVTGLIRLHIDDIIAKPFQSNVIIEKLSTILEKGHGHTTALPNDEAPLSNTHTEDGTVAALSDNKAIPDTDKGDSAAIAPPNEEPPKLE